MGNGEYGEVKNFSGKYFLKLPSDSLGDLSTRGDSQGEARPVTYKNQSGEWYCKPGIQQSS